MSNLHGIDLEIIAHKLNGDPIFKLVRQGRKKFAPEKN